MPGGFAPRLLIEAGFLILVGVGAGLADLRTVVIVVLLAVAWLLVALIELAVWLAQLRTVGPAVVAPPFEPAPEGIPAVQPGLDAGEPEEDAYPLRAEAGSVPSAEVEAYTRVLDVDEAGASPDERAE